MRFLFIERHRQRWPTTLMCQVLHVSRSGFYAWKKRPESDLPKRRHKVLTMIRVVHQEHRETYGSPRMHRELIARGYSCCVNFVAKVMKQGGIAAKTKRRFKVTTNSKHKHAVAENVLDRRFAQSDPNQAWVSDITYIYTREGWLYLATVQELYSRQIVGWSMADRLTSRLTVDALRMAIDRRQPPRGLLLHSDRGSQYASDHFQLLLRKHGIRPSMSRKGDCWDNAVMESFFHTLKTELTYWEDYQTRDDAKRSVFEYIELFYNPKRRHSSLGYLSPVQFEQAA